MSDEKTHWKKNFNYDYMGSYSLEDGNDVIVTIRETKKQLVKGTGGKEQECFVCYFTDSPKPMILNRTNCKIISKLYGSPYIEDWAGLKIQLYSAKVDAFGEKGVDALRIRDFKPEKESNASAIKALEACKTLAQLQAVYRNLSKQLQGDTEVIKLKDKLKKQLPA